MKELSIEEKAKAYDNLLVKLQKAKENSDVCDDRYCCVIDAIVPELKESEDERIRRAIIATIHLYYGEPLEDEAKEMIAWLEKHGEQKVADKIEPIEWSGKIKSRKVKGVLKEMLDEKLKSSWSEEDKKIYSRIYDLIHAAAFADYDVDEDGKELGEYAKITGWFKSLKDRYTWKPSDGQIKICKKVYADILSAKGFDLGTVNSELNRLEEELKELKAQKGE